MRALAVVALAVAAAACGPPSSGCERDSECSGDVCARNGECLPSSSVRVVRVMWTVNGQTASPTNCAQTPNLYLMFLGFDVADTFGFEPVPCEAGLFTIDKLPTRFGSVEIGDTGSRFRQEKVIDSQNNVSFDLAP